MSETAFVGREAELSRLDGYLSEALSGQGRMCFLAGEPGSGKTALAREFTRRSQTLHGDLLVAVGDCNAQTGGGEPFLPFREVLALLTGDLEAKVAQGAISQEGATRLERFLGASIRALIDAGPDLIGVLVPGAGLAAKIGKAVAEQAGIDSKVIALLKRERPAGALPQPAVQREQIFEQYARFLVELARRQPLLVILDDLQWIDISSSDLLFHLSRRIANSRILVVGTYRPADLSARTADKGSDQHFLENVLAEIKRNYGDVSVDLDARDERTARQFVHALVDRERNGLLFEFREKLYRWTGGNPLFVL
ncbi:MAG: AAA family ATPase, partial [Anaerolineae bacterium]|nr:AAA family ATPase [Anaerolineae bacterium]